MELYYWFWFMTPSRTSVQWVPTFWWDITLPTFRLQVSLFRHYFNNRLPDYTVSQPRRLQHKTFRQAPRLSTVSITPPICHTHAGSPASAAVDALLGSCEVTEFRNNISLPSSRVNQSNSFWTTWPLKMGVALSRHVVNKLPTYAA